MSATSHMQATHFRTSGVFSKSGSLFLTNADVNGNFRMLWMWINMRWNWLSSPRTTVTRFIWAVFVLFCFLKAQRCTIGMSQSRTSHFTIRNVKERERHGLFRESVPEALVEHQTLIIAFVPPKRKENSLRSLFHFFFPLSLLLQCVHGLTFMWAETNNSNSIPST